MVTKFHHVPIQSLPTDVNKVESRRQDSNTTRRVPQLHRPLEKEHIKQLTLRYWYEKAKKRAGILNPETADLDVQWNLKETERKEKLKKLNE